VVGGGFAFIAALGAAWLTSAGTNHTWATVITVLGALGVTASTLLAKAKSQAQDLLGELRAAFDADLVKEAATVAPLPQSRPRWLLR
jgi:hypothetical protein